MNRHNIVDRLSKPRTLHRNPEFHMGTEGTQVHSSKVCLLQNRKETQEGVRNANKTIKWIFLKSIQQNHEVKGLGRP